jgi:Uma2 family endonuclease
MIFTFIEQHRLGFYFGRLYYELSDSLVLIPDASFVSHTKLKFPLPQKMSQSPNLAIEIILPESTNNLIRSKIEAYLAHGTQLVWIVYPEDKVVDVWRAMPDGSLNKRAFGMNETLSGENVLPNFTLPIRDIFSDEFAS